MWEVWPNKLLPMAFKSCPKSNKSPDLVTLIERKTKRERDIKIGREGGRENPGAT